MAEVDMRVAWEWSCPGCEATNFDPSVTVEIPPDDEFLQFLADQTFDGELCTKPKSVKCKSCGNRFSVKADPQDDLDEWIDDDEGEDWKR